MVSSDSPWHAGELTLQGSIGAVEEMKAAGAELIHAFLDDRHRHFLESLPLVFVGAVDPTGDVWATVRSGLPGFLSSTDPRYLALRVGEQRGDPASKGLVDGASMAVIGIDLASRRRARVNGQIVRASASGLLMRVDEAYPNCPQYIQRRVVAFSRDPALDASIAAEHLAGLDAAARSLIGLADSFFVASYVDLPGGRRVDVSHRGGRPGFVQIDPDNWLTVPDFAGNHMFCTLGNILRCGRAGVVFVDFEQGDLLQISGPAEVILDSPDISAFPGAERLWRLQARRIVRRRRALPPSSTLHDDGRSPSLDGTGTWNEARINLARRRAAADWRPLRIVRVVDESDSVKSLFLEAADGEGVVPFRAAQHLPIRVDVAGSALVRTYTLSGPPAADSYRISVKRQGAASTRLHGLKPGELLAAKPPAGGFLIDSRAPRPAVLLAAGIGVTPILAMAYALEAEGRRNGPPRKAFIFYSAQSKADRALDRELNDLATRGGSSVRLVRILTDTEGATRGVDYEVGGRIEIALLKDTLPFDDYDFYLCGPPSFMQSLYDGLRGLNIADDRIHAEAFGPASLVRHPGATAIPDASPSSDPVEVTFTASGKQATWLPGSPSLLELAESQGIKPEYGCRKGSCGTCHVRCSGGDIAYLGSTTAAVEKSEVLVCCAVPAAGSSAIVLDL